MLEPVDYRQSHLEQGPEYENMLNERPWPRFQAAREREILSWLIPKLFKGGPINHVDFACGTGRILQQIEAMSDNSLGVDVSTKMTDIARNRCKKARFLIKDVTESGLEGSYNLATAFRFFGNAQDDLRSRVMSVLSNSLVEGGFLVINNHRNPRTLRFMLRRFPAGKAEAKDENPYNRLDLTYPKLKSLLSQNSLEIVHAVPIGFWVLRATWQAKISNDSSTVRFLERCFSFRRLASLSPDAIIVCKKITKTT